MVNKVFKVIFLALVLSAVCMSAALIPTGSEEEAEARNGGVKYGKRIVAAALNKSGTPYGWGRGAMVCTELTRHAVGKATGIYMVTDPGAQLGYGWQPRRKKPGDIVFFDENGPAGPPTHVGIYSGNGQVVHASDYFNRVIESDMGYIHGYDGARRVRP